MHSSIKLNTPCELIDITPLNPLISKCIIKVCYIGENRNKTVITKEVAKDMANSLPGTPIVGFFNEEDQDFEEHNRSLEVIDGKIQFKDQTRPYGFVDLNARVWFQDYLDDNNTIHTYLVTEGYLWTGQYQDVQRVIKHGNNQSMELDTATMKGSWTITDNKKARFFIISEAIISKLCILGENYEPCFEGAGISKFSLEDDFNEKIYSLMKQVRELKGGSSSVDNNDIQVETVEVEVEAEPEVVEEYAAAAPAEVEQVENVVEPEPVVEAEVEPAHDYEAELAQAQERYSALENTYNELLSNYQSLEQEVVELRGFKLAREREDKQSLIDSFIMLSDEEKGDVITNIDNYSLDDIEAKLSIICVRNKLDLSEKTDNDSRVRDTSYSLNNLNNDDDDDEVPALVSALRSVKEKDNKK